MDGQVVNLDDSYIFVETEDCDIVQIIDKDVPKNVHKAKNQAPDIILLSKNNKPTANIAKTREPAVVLINNNNPNIIQTRISQKMPQRPDIRVISSPDRPKLQQQSKAKVAEAASAIKCPICWDELSEIQTKGAHLLAASDCGHVLCSKCLQNILSKNVKSLNCPTCRKRVTKSKFVKLFF